MVPQAGRASGIKEGFGLAKALGALKNMRGARKQPMIHDNYRPKMEVDAQTCQVPTYGQLLTCVPATSLAMTHCYFLF